MLEERYPCWLANEPFETGKQLAVTNKYTGDVATKVALADASHIDKGIAAAVEAQKELNRWPAHKRRAVLAHVVTRLEERHEELSRVLAIEAGKPIKDSRGEVTRGSRCDFSPSPFRPAPGLRPRRPFRKATSRSTEVEGFPAMPVPSPSCRARRFSARRSASS